MARPKFFSFLGWSGSGKTSLIAGLAEGLKSRGMSCAVVKKSRHEADIQPRAKDSRRYLEAGALRSIYLSGKEALVFLQPPSAPDADWLEGLAGGADFVLLEGLDLNGARKVLVGGRAANEADLKRPFGAFDALISDCEGLRELAARRGVASFAPSNLLGLLDFITSED